LFVAKFATEERDERRTSMMFDGKPRDIDV